MSIPSNTVTQFRDLWADRFVDTITVTRIAGRGTFNATTLGYDSGSTSTVFTGAALLRPVQDIDLAQFGGQLDTATGMLIFVAHDAATFDIEDLVTVNVCALDPDLVAETLTVVAVTYDSYQTRQRLVGRLSLGAGHVG